MYYTGITRRGIGKRLGDYLHSRGYGYVNKYWKHSRKIPVYVEYLFGNEYEAMRREKTIKNLRITKKKELIESEKNRLVGYKPLKHLILKRNKDEGQIVIKVK